jgi:hypothetical protein
MQIYNNTLRQNERTRTISAFPGVYTSIAESAGNDYLEMRAAQLSALNHLLTSGDFDGWDSTIQADAKWLAASLADEVKLLVQAVIFRDNLERESDKV